MRISIRHELRFAVGEATGHSVQHLLLTPARTPSQDVIEWTIDMPGIGEAASFTDAFGNRAHLVSQQRAEQDLIITVSGVVETSDTNGVVGRLPDDPNLALFRRTTGQTRPNGNLVNRMRAHTKSGMSRLDVLHWLMTRLHEARDSVPGDEDESPEIIAEDHAHVFVAACRGMDIPARFVTGYLLAQEGGQARMHAWAEAWDDGLGWVGFDPATNLCPTQFHVRLAVGLDAETSVPVRLVPTLDRATDDIIALDQILASQSQQQQTGSQTQSGA